MVGQQANGLVVAQGLDHLANAADIGGHGAQAGALTHGLHHLGQPGLAGGTVEHGQVAILLVKALRHGLRRDLETAHVRRQEDDALARAISLLHVLQPAPLAMHRLAQPQPWQLGQHAAIVGDGRAHIGQRQTGQRSVVTHAAAIGRSSEPAQPAQHGTHAMQQPERKPGKDSEQECH